MWIRSQDKTTLVEAKELNVKQKEKMVYHRRGGEEDLDYELCKEYELYVNDCWFGEYSNEAKAMKVLDMIQKEIIDSNLFFSDNNGVPTKVMPITKVFQMPSDDEVE